MCPSSSDTANLDSLSLADELSRVADTIKWSKPLRMGEFEKIAEMATGTGYFALGNLLETSATERVSKSRSSIPKETQKTEVPPKTNLRIYIQKETSSRFELCFDALYRKAQVATLFVGKHTW